ncbi:MAG TPA: sugar phosphate isomerase/epimerase family protein [Armatimonadota bacterium]|nr:sugar phosphate isomerase/epimerase family protein [Armatimonadota bacterium]
MRLGCAAYSYRDALSSGKMTLEQFVDRCAAMDMDGVELTSYYFPSTDPEYLRSLKRRCFLKGQHILGTAVGSDFTRPDESKRREQVKMTLNWIDHSVILGAPCIRVFAGGIQAGVSEDQAFGWALECLQECVAYGEQSGVCVALENHGGVTGTAEQVSRFLEAIDNPWFGLNLDLGNFHVDPYAEFAALAPRVITTHAKLTTRFGAEQREIDYARVKAILSDAGYRGYLSIEFEEDEDPEVGVPRFVEQLKSLR